MLRVWLLVWALAAQMRSRTTSLPWLRQMLASKLESTTGVLSWCLPLLRRYSTSRREGSHYQLTAHKSAEKALLCRLITGNFVHDSFVHLAGSSYALATVCPAIEEILGWDIFLAVYLMSALGGSVATFTLGDALTVGASSGIFGLIGEAQLKRNDSEVLPPCSLR